MIAPAAKVDPVVLRAYQRHFHVLSPANELLGEAEVVERARRVASAQPGYGAAVPQAPAGVRQIVAAQAKLVSIWALPIRYDVRDAIVAHRARKENRAMARYMLSVHSVEGEVREPPTAEEIAHNWQQLRIVEAEMKATGAWVFSARLHGPDTATVVRVANGEILTTDGPFAEAREHLGGFYVINAADLDAALGWASKVTRCIGSPIELRPFADFADEPRA